MGRGALQQPAVRCLCGDPAGGRVVDPRPDNPPRLAARSELALSTPPGASRPRPAARDTVLGYAAGAGIARANAGGSPDRARRSCALRRPPRSAHSASSVRRLPAPAAGGAVPIAGVARRARRGSAARHSFYTFHVVSYLVDMGRGHAHRPAASGLSRSTSRSSRSDRRADHRAGASSARRSSGERAANARGRGGALPRRQRLPQEGGGGGRTRRVRGRVWTDPSTAPRVPSSSSRCTPTRSRSTSTSPDTPTSRAVWRASSLPLPENFRHPYLAANPREFWQRWHISLSSCCGTTSNFRSVATAATVRTVVNLLITMLLGGLWHGAAWTFVLWAPSTACGSRHTACGPRRCRADPAVVPAPGDVPSRRRRLGVFRAPSLEAIHALADAFGAGHRTLDRSRSAGAARPRRHRVTSAGGTDRHGRLVARGAATRTRARSSGSRSSSWDARCPQPALHLLPVLTPRRRQAWRLLVLTACVVVAAGVAGLRVARAPLLAAARRDAGPFTVLVLRSRLAGRGARGGEIQARAGAVLGTRCGRCQGPRTSRPGSRARWRPGYLRRSPGLDERGASAVHFHALVEPVLAGRPRFGVLEVNLGRWRTTGSTVRAPSCRRSWRFSRSAGRSACGRARRPRRRADRRRALQGARRSRDRDDRRRPARDGHGDARRRRPSRERRDGSGGAAGGIRPPIPGLPGSSTPPLPALVRSKDRDQSRLRVLRTVRAELVGAGVKPLFVVAPVRIHELAILGVAPERVRARLERMRAAIGQREPSGSTPAEVPCRRIQGRLPRARRGARAMAAQVAERLRQSGVLTAPPPAGT